MPPSLSLRYCGTAGGHAAHAAQGVAPVAQPPQASARGGGQPQRATVARPAPQRTSSTWSTCRRRQVPQLAALAEPHSSLPVLAPWAGPPGSFGGAAHSGRAAEPPTAHNEMREAAVRPFVRAGPSRRFCGFQRPGTHRATYGRDTADDKAHHAMVCTACFQTGPRRGTGKVPSSCPRPDLPRLPTGTCHAPVSPVLRLASRLQLYVCVCPRLDGNPCCGSSDLVWDQEGVLAAGCKVVGCLER